MELDGDRRQVAVGDAVLIPPGAWHQIRAGDEGRLPVPLLLRARVPARGHLLRVARRWDAWSRITIGLQVIPQHGDYEQMKRAWVEADELGRRPDLQLGPLLPAVRRPGTASTSSR